MSRPSTTTPVRIVIAILASLGDWADKYDASIKRLYGDGFEAGTRSRDLRTLLEERQNAYLRERREDVGHTNERQAVVEETRTLIASGLSLARIVFDDKDNFDDILADFASKPPSQVRSPNTAMAALAQLKTAFELHRDAMEDVFPNLSDFDDKIDELIARVEEVQSDDVRENQQTREAREKREETRKESVKFIRDLHLGAEAVEIFQPAALRDLNVLFETHNPTRSSDPDPDAPAPAEDDVDADQDTPTPAEDPTPTGGGADTDADPDDNFVDAPTDA